MSKTKTKCEKCSNRFPTKKNLASKRAIMVAGAGSGAALGAKAGLAMGPYGAIAATVPGAVCGGALGALADQVYVTCPDCNKTQKA